MSNLNEFLPGSAKAGSPTNASDTGAGSAVDPVQHANLEALAGRLGQEVGEYRDFFESVKPLLEKLDENPKLAQAIVDGKIDMGLVDAVLEGKITPQQATDATKTAHSEVKKELGAKGMNGISSDDLTKLIDEKVSSIKEEMNTKMQDVEDLRVFESNVQDFIANTPDFATYAKSIDAWLDEHDITDIKVAYYAVKGELSENAAKKLADEDRAEYEKGLALNAGGGGHRVTYSGAEGAKLIDQLIDSRPNPNNFG